MALLSNLCQTFFVLIQYIANCNVNKSSEAVVLEDYESKNLKVKIPAKRVISVI